MTAAVVAYIDGGARGNPGPAGYGVRIESSDGTLVEQFHGSIGVATNNVAEYRGLIAALEWVESHGYRRLLVRSDSLLLVQQMRGVYKVRNAGLQPLHAKAHQLAREIGQVTFEHVGRALNAHADRLANAAMDQGESTVDNDRGGRERVDTVTVDNRHADGSPFSELERAVRVFVYRHLVDTARAPELADLSRALEVASDFVASALRRLADLHALVLAPASLNIWMAHPFSAVPTSYPVVANGRTYFANCAWDAAGILSILRADGECATRCADGCGSELRMRVRAGRIEGDGIVHLAVPPRRFWDNIAFT
jgi:ribonuclease HI